jgi:hypothetical protein
MLRDHLGFTFSCLKLMEELSSHTFLLSDGEDNAMGSVYKVRLMAAVANSEVVGASHR